jgi:isoquinoline 1-oxidoreductase subunit beta
MDIRVDRREFLKSGAALGGGLALQFSVAAPALAQVPAEVTEVTHWIVIHPDDRVVIRIARSEMGQGSLTGLAQLVAEELECDWNKVSTEFASPNEHIKRKRIWGSMSTGGSAGIRTSQDYLRKSGAAAREMLVSAAATQWNVPAAECSAASGVITHGPSKRRVSYGKVAAAASKLDAPKEPKLKDAREWKLIGKPVRRLDVPDKVRGLPVFGIDVQQPGMLHASIVQSPVFLGKVKSVDDSEARRMRGVKGVVREEGWVAVVADNWWRANEAAKKLRIEWDNGKNADVSTESIFASFRKGWTRRGCPPPARSAMRRPRSPPPRKWSKPSTRRRTSATRPWSR